MLIHYPNIKSLSSMVLCVKQLIGMKYSILVRNVDDNDGL